MKQKTLIYWAVTAPMAALMLLSAAPDLLQVPLAVSIFGHLGYPTYLLPFLGVAKTLGVVTVLFSPFPRLKEWAYAGLLFDVTGALYSHLSVGDPGSAWAPAAVAIGLISGSYLTHRVRLSANGILRAPRVTDATVSGRSAAW
ncbi:MAG TPA: DoxX family protein [Vicinamibacterales bacterium]|nr:DoxX family protein [Vicinamibacterales bacterium]